MDNTLFLPGDEGCKESWKDYPAPDFLTHSINEGYGGRAVNSYQENAARSRLKNPKRLHQATSHRTTKPSTEAYSAVDIGGSNFLPASAFGNQYQSEVCGGPSGLAQLPKDSYNAFLAMGRQPASPTRAFSQCGPPYMKYPHPMRNDQMSTGDPLMTDASLGSVPTIGHSADPDTALTDSHRLNQQSWYQKERNCENYPPLKLSETASTPEHMNSFTQRSSPVCTRPPQPIHGETNLLRHSLDPTRGFFYPPSGSAHGWTAQDLFLCPENLAPSIKNHQHGYPRTGYPQTHQDSAGDRHSSGLYPFLPDHQVQALENKSGVQEDGFVWQGRNPTEITANYTQDSSGGLKTRHIWDDRSAAAHEGIIGWQAASKSERCLGSRNNHVQDDEDLVYDEGDGSEEEGSEGSSPSLPVRPSKRRMTAQGHAQRESLDSLAYTTSVPSNVRSNASRTVDVDTNEDDDHPGYGWGGETKHWCRFDQNGNFQVCKKKGQQWRNAIRHDDIRAVLYNAAKAQGDFDYSRASGTDPGDLTSFHPFQKNWDLDDRRRWPKILFRLERHGWWGDQDRCKPQGDWIRKGRVVVDRDNRPLKVWPLLNDCCSSQFEAAAFEALNRYCPKLGPRDIFGRTPDVADISGPSAFSSRRLNFRERNGLISWFGRCESDVMQKATREAIGQWGRDHNSTKRFLGFSKERLVEIKAPNKELEASKKKSATHQKRIAAKTSAEVR